MAYVNFAYYRDIYHGTAIAESDFPRLADIATADINLVTFDRAVEKMAGTDTDLIDLIKRATCAVAETNQAIEKSGGADAITQESQGRYSISYGANSSKQKTNFEKIKDAAYRYLANTGLMFNGFYAGEYDSKC